MTLKRAFARLRARPVMSCVTLIVLAFGLGSVSAILATVTSVTESSLPVRDATQLRLARWSAPGGLPESLRAEWFGLDEHVTLPFAVFEAFSAQLRSAKSVFAMTPLGIGPAKVPAVIGTRAASLVGEAVSDNYFEGLGVVPHRGRLPKGCCGDGQTAATPEIVISDRAWTELFARDPAVVGQPIQLGGRSFAIVGVMGGGFTGVIPGRGSDFWVPLTSWSFPGPWTNAPSVWWLTVFVRIDPAQQEAAATEARQLFASVLKDVYHLDGPITAPILQLDDGARGVDLLSDAAAPFARVLRGVAYLVLALVVVAVAGLLLGYFWTARSDWAIELALGASRRRIVVHVMTDVLLLLLCGAIAAAVIGSVATAYVTSTLSSLIEPAGLSLVSTAGVLDLSLWSGSVVAGLGAAALFALIAIVAQLDAAQLLRVATSYTSERGLRIFRVLRLFVVAEIAVSLVLVGGAGLLVRTMIALRQIDLGFEPAALVFATVRWAQPSDVNEEVIARYERLRQLGLSMPSQQSVSVSMLTPLSSLDIQLPFARPGSPEPVPVGVNLVGADYFRTMGVTMHRGRPIALSDVAASRKVLVLSRRAADLLFPQGEPVGSSVRFLGGAFEIIGVCDDVRYQGVTTEPSPRAYLPYSVLAGMVAAAPDGMTLIMRTTQPSATVRAVGERLRAESAGSEVRVRTAVAQVDRGLSQQLVLARVAGVVALLSLILAVIGAYGIVADAVLVRRRELAIRLALGATRTKAVRLVVGDVLITFIAAAALSVPLLIVTKRVLSAWLYGVSAVDPVTWGTAAAIVGTAVGLGAYLPSRRAASMNPAQALKC